MTQQSKEEIFRIYLDGKIDFARKDQMKALNDLFGADFGTAEYFDAAERYEQTAKKAGLLISIKTQFNNIFKEES